MCYLQNHPETQRISLRVWQHSRQRHGSQHSIRDSRHHLHAFSMKDNAIQLHTSEDSNLVVYLLLVVG
jgi:hypothetical protein